MDNKQKFNEKNKRIDDALAMKVPDRVPCIPQAQTFPFINAGYTMAEVMYDTTKAKDAVRKYLKEFDPDSTVGYDIVFAGQGPLMEKIGINWLQWAGRPGCNIDKNSIHQFIEKPYLSDDEYPELLTDLTGWIMRRWFPRCFKAMEPLANIDLRGALGYGYLPAMMQFNPQITEVFKTMSEVGDMVKQWYGEFEEFNRELMEIGYPYQIAATTTCAFDRLSDTLRGTIDTMADLYEQPENVHAAIEMFYPSTLYAALAQAQHSSGKLVMIPLHKGLDGFMGLQQYKEFYWPTLQRLILDLIDHGCTPWIFTEGKYDSRLECIIEGIPSGKALYHFEDVDMKEAKRIVGAHSCISGGFSSRILTTGTPEKVKDEVKRLLDICAPGGGYMFDLSDTLDEADPRNVEAMFDAVKTYGKY